MEYSRGNKKANPKVEIHNLLNKRFTNGIWKVNPPLHLRDLASFCNVHTSAISKDDKVCTIGMFRQWSRPYCNNTHRKSKDEESNHIVNTLDKAIKNPNQFQAVSAGEKSR